MASQVPTEEAVRAALRGLIALKGDPRDLMTQIDRSYWYARPECVETRGSV